MATEVLGVLGGMGPAATADFLLRLARLTPAARDQDHLPTIVYSDPQTPDRSDAILGRGPSPLPALLRGIEFLNQAGCALIAIPCNSAHHWYEQMADHSTVPILHIADAAAGRLRHRPGVRTVGVLATDGTIRSGIYQPRLGAAGVATLELAGLGEANPVMRGIRAMKAGQEAVARETLRTAGQQLVGRGAQALVLACTDVSAALAGVTEIDATPVLDASDCLAQASLDRLHSRTG
jgi:aspartate racemase